MRNTGKKRTRRLTAASLTLIMLLSLSIPVFAAPASFSDVPENHTFHDAIMWSAGKGIVGGYSDGTFQPAKTVSRSNFAVMLSRAFYASEVAANQANPAYTQQGTFYPNFMALKNDGILNGTSWPNSIANTSFMGQGITRFEMATLMTNIMNQKGFAASDAEKSTAIPKITDYNSIWSGYQNAVANVYALGIITGYAGGSFNGDGIMNRGQACVVIYRMMQYAGNTSGGEVVTPVPEVPVEPETGSTKATTPSTLALRDGSAVTEENVLNRIQEILKQYPEGAPWGESGNNVGTRDSSVSIGGYELGSPSAAITEISTKYSVNMRQGCGGFAGLVSDAIFGGSTTGGEKFPIRQLDSVSQVRPGDILVELNANGVQQHILTAASRIMDSTVINGITRYSVAKYDGNVSGGHVAYNNYGNYYITDELYRDHYYVAYTRYPDNSSGSGIAAPVPEVPVEPETGSTESAEPSTLTLRDGSAVTEENVLKIIDEILQVYPSGTTWNDNTSRNSNITIAGRELGSPSGDVINVGLRHGVSMLQAYGGFAGLVSDAIFGGSTTNRANFPERQLDSVSQIRPGDIIVKLDANGATDHVLTAASSVKSSKTVNGVQVYFIGTYEGNASGVVNYDNYDNHSYVTDELFRGASYVAYTRYPD